MLGYCFLLKMYVYWLKNNLYTMGGIQSKTKRKLLFLGLDNAGKSTMLKCLTGDNTNLDVVSPTRGFARKQLQYSGFDFTIFDVGGQTSLRCHWCDYYAKTSGIVWVIDSTDRRRMFETGLELRTVLEDENLSGVPLLICANKQDMMTAMKADEITIELELHGIRNRNWHIQDCSAITGDGVEEGLKWMTQNFFEEKKAPQKIERRQVPQQTIQPHPTNKPEPKPSRAARKEAAKPTHEEKQPASKPKRGHNKKAAQEETAPPENPRASDNDDATEIMLPKEEEAGVGTLTAQNQANDEAQPENNEGKESQPAAEPKDDE